MGKRKPTARERAGREVWRRVQEGARVALPDIRKYQYAGLVAEPVKPFLRWAEAELAELLADKGDGATAAERAALEDVARLGLILRCEFARYLETQDQAAAQRVTALAGQRRASLQAVGLERRARPVTLGSVVAELEREKNGKPTPASSTPENSSPDATSQAAIVEVT